MDNRDRDRGNTGPRINHRIRVPQVRVVSNEGEMLGVLETSDALRRAREAGLDLVEVNPKAFPPVCKIMDFGKFKYEEKKRQGEARKRQALIELKEIKIRPKTDEHDIDFKVRHIERFLEEGNKVKITCRFRGREITHPEMAMRQLQVLVERTREIAQVEVEPRMEGRTMTLILAPSTKNQNKPKRRVEVPGDQAETSAEG
jgi:translation initiation factor IF-3